MKTITLFAIIASLSITSCSTVKDTSNSALEQARTNISVGIGTQKVEGGYEVSGHASTRVFGLEPYGSFTAGVRYVPTVKPESK